MFYWFIISQTDEKSIGRRSKHERYQLDSISTFFCMLKPARPDMHGNLSQAEQDIFANHCQYLQEKFNEKTVLQAGTSFEKGHEGFAIVILRAHSKEEATSIIEADPAVKSGLLKVKVTQYSIFLDRGMN